MDSELYSAIDANINRSLEGIRVCEDIFRFVIHNSNLSFKLKEIRHDISRAVKIFPFENLLTGRNTGIDTQKFADLKSENTRNSIFELAKSNLHRAMEAMRLLEEFSKFLLPSESAETNDTNQFKKIRFQLYSLEKEIIMTLLKEEKLKYFNNSLYAIIDSAFVNDNEYKNAAIRMINGGASIIQLRMKNHSMAEILKAAREISNICKKHNVLFFVNDHTDIARLSEADGVHLGQDDLSVSDARKLLPVNMMIGKSTHSIEQAVLAAAEEPDYIAIGPLFDTKTKNGERIKGIGEKTANKIKDIITLPLVCIGGLDPERIQSIKTTGCYCYAVISYLFKNNTIEENCRNIVINL